MTFTVYIALDRDMKPLYVGSTTNLPNRVAWHREESPWSVDAYRWIQYECPDKATMLAEERRLIGEHNPPWNWLSRTIPNPRPKLSREECLALVAERRALPQYRESAEWQALCEVGELLTEGLDFATERRSA